MCILVIWFSLSAATASQPQFQLNNNYFQPHKHEITKQDSKFSNATATANVEKAAFTNCNYHCISYSCLVK